jgi:diguanylate cyclase (GGDEF)-like protein/PAS domain S-box-containing protein
VDTGELSTRLKRRTRDTDDLTVTELVSMRTELAEHAAAARVLHALVPGSAISTILLNTDLTVAWASQSVREVIGYDAHELIGMQGFDLVHPDDAGELADLVINELTHPSDYLERADPARLALNTMRLRHRDGTWVGIEFSVNNETANPDVEGFLLHVTPSVLRSSIDRAMTAVVQLRPAADVLEHVANILRSLVDRSTVLVEADGLRSAAATWMHEALADMVARGESERIGDDGSLWLHAVEVDGDAVGRMLVHSELRTPLTMWTRTCLTRIAPLIEHLVVRDRMVRRLQVEAASDPLTGLANRRGLSLCRAPGGTDDDTGLRAAICIDLDDFKAINDRFGHEVGDRALTEVARRIRAAVRPDDVVARLGGDEFCVWATVPSPEYASALASRIGEAIGDQPWCDGTRTVNLGATIGVATGRASEPDGLVRAADLAMVERKATAKGQIAFAAPR